MAAAVNNKESALGKGAAVSETALASRKAAVNQKAIGVQKVLVSEKTVAGSDSAAAAQLLGSAGAFAAQLAQWFADNRRVLPWREDPSAYKTVVSELMLQQTQVVTALPYFERWVARWPDFASLAAASEADVLQMWEGLGYYTRARNLLKLARAWVQAQVKPVTAEQWLAYPGVGPYTAAAIASIAFNQHSAVVDGNVVRVLARLCADATAFASAAHAVKAFTPLAQGMIAQAKAPGLHNEAMMELGATLCRKGQTQCLLCPVGEFCHGKSLGAQVDALPRITRKKIEKRRVDRLLVVDCACNAVLLHRYGQGARRLAGLCELPLWQDVAPFMANATQKSPPATKPLLVRHRSIANERIEERIYALDVADSVVVGVGTDAMATAGGLFWQKLDALDSVTLTGPHRRWLTQLLEK